jgi:hypothetical protein
MSILAIALLLQEPDLKWHPNLAAGKTAAARAKRPIFLLTIWKPDV